MTSATGPCQACRKSWASSTSSFVNAGAFSFSRSTIATLDSPHTVHASLTTSACGSAVIPRTAQLARRAPHAGHSIVRMRSRIAPIQSTHVRTAHPTPPGASLGRTAAERAPAQALWVVRERTDERAGDAGVCDELLPHALQMYGIRCWSTAAPREQRCRARAERSRGHDDAVPTASDALGVRRVAVRRDVFVHVVR